MTVWPEVTSLHRVYRNGVGGWYQRGFAEVVGAVDRYIDPNHFDEGLAELSWVPGNEWTLQRVWRMAGGMAIVAYGQATYKTKADAIAAIDTEKPEEYPAVVVNGVLVWVLAVRGGATDLSDMAQAELREPPDSETKALAIVDNDHPPDGEFDEGGGTLQEVELDPTSCDLPGHTHCYSVVDPRPLTYEPREGMPPIYHRTKPKPLGFRVNWGIRFDIKSIRMAPDVYDEMLGHTPGPFRSCYLRGVTIHEDRALPPGRALCIYPKGPPVDVEQEAVRFSELLKRIETYTV